MPENNPGKPSVRRRRDRLRNRLLDWIRTARRRAQAEQALPRSLRRRLWLQRQASALVALYLLVNLLLPHVVVIVMPASIECRIVDAVTGAPIPDALASVAQQGLEARSDRHGRAMLVLRTTPLLHWVWPSIGSYNLGGWLMVSAANYRTVELPLPASFEWPWFGEPHVRLPDVRLEPRSPRIG